MKKKPDFNGNFYVEDAMRLAQSDAGKQLIAMLQNTNSDRVQAAMDHAAAGDYEKAKQTISSLLSSPEAKQLLEQLGG